MVMSRIRTLRSIPVVVIAILLLEAVPAYSSQDRVRITALAIDPVTPTNLYAGTYGGGVFKSTDGGTSWSPTLISIPASTLVIDPLTPDTLYAGDYGGDVYKS